MKVIRVMDTITVVLSNGGIISSDNCTDEMFMDIYNHQNDEEYVQNLLLPEFQTKKVIAKAKKELFEGIEVSKYLVAKGASVYIPTISELSLPEDLVTAFLKAEKEDNKELIQTYLNFWTLVSLNPDSRCRQNMFWFLNKYGMKISKSGLFIGYRNVLVKKEGDSIDAKLAQTISSEYSRIKFISKKSPKDYMLCKEDGEFVTKKATSIKDEDNVVGPLDKLYTSLSNVEVTTVYTDAHTRTFEIKIGQIVSMPREKCDTIQENSCSKGLHVAGRDWLENNYFGDTGMMVLVNPADVVAVPPIDDYGKMRTCAYYPVAVVEFGEDGHIIELPIEDGFEDDFFEKICYHGQKNDNDLNPYQVEIPEIPELDKSLINERLLKTARSLKKSVEEKDCEDCEDCEDSEDCEIRNLFNLINELLEK